MEKIGEKRKKNITLRLNLERIEIQREKKSKSITRTIRQTPDEIIRQKKLKENKTSKRKLIISQQY